MIKHSRLKGFTNIEMILVVGIVSILSTVVYFIYDNASDKRQVSSEINNISGLIKKIVSATTATDYKGLSNQALRDMGIYYQSEFKDFEVKGLSHKSFQVTYSLLNSRACSDLAMKTASMKGEYKLTRKINGVDAGFTPAEVANACNTQQNKLELVFDGLNIQNIASVTPGIPKPPPNYVGEGTFTPDLPDRGDVPTNLADASKNTNNPSKPIPGLYKPPEYVVATSPTSPNGNAPNPGSFVRPEYIPNVPLGPLTNPPDNGNEFVPAVPPVPPRPPATAPPPPKSKNVRLDSGPRAWPVLDARGFDKFNANISIYKDEIFGKCILAINGSINYYTDTYYFYTEPYLDKSQNLWFTNQIGVVPYLSDCYELERLFNLNIMIFKEAETQHGQ